MASRSVYYVNETKSPILHGKSIMLALNYKSIRLNNNNIMWIKIC